MINIKREHFRFEIRKQKNEKEFAKRRIITQSQHSSHQELLQLQYKLQRLENCEQELLRFLNYDQIADFLLEDLTNYANLIENTNSLNLAIRCLTNQIYYGAQLKIYNNLKVWFKVPDFQVKEACLKCLSNWAHDNQGYGEQIQIDFFGKFEVELCDSYSYLIYILSRQCKFSELIRCMQILQDIIMNKPNVDTFAAMKKIFKLCTPLEASDLVLIDYQIPIIRLIKLSFTDMNACAALIQLINKLSECEAETIYSFGIKQLIEKLLNSNENKQMGLKVILAFQNESVNNGYIIDDIFERIFDNDWLYQYLLTDIDDLKITVICNSMQMGSIFAKFLQMGVIHKLFIPVLKENDRNNKKMILETICSIIQRDELTTEKFKWVQLQFITQDFQESLYLDDDPEIYQIKESIQYLIADLLQ